MTVKSLVSKRTIYIGATIVFILIVVVATLSFYLQKPISTTPKAAIIDQLSSSYLTSSSRSVNQTFINETRTLLYTHFPEVDYYSDNATVDNYKNLPSDGYKLIIWRAHSAKDESGKFIAISTSENNGTSDYPQYSNGELTLCYIQPDPTFYFAITPKFITEVMSGRFDDTVIILMTCNGLEGGYTKTAEALEEKGAKAIISWDNWIEASNNDGATALLLNYLINENNTIQQAVAKIPQQPPSPFGGPSQMKFFPTSNETAAYRIPNYNEKATISNAWPAGMPTLQNVDAEGSNRANHEPEVDSAKLLDVSIALKRSRIAGYEELHPQD
ncbi:MAG: hypothetical protein ABSC91_00010 [Candidatus Bathyarchaeia archaeon]|jgi:type II secretory pathway pseudopilin PulG